jgi:MOSC domain-containing protein YiiM
MVSMSSAEVVAVSRAAEHGFAKQPQDFVELIAGEGVAGDAHRGVTVQHLYQVRRDPTQPNLCQVHLLEVEKLDELAADGIELGPGEMGENVLTRGIDLLALPRQAVLRLGAEAVVEITGLRTPCSQIDGYRRGLQARMWGPRDAHGVRERRAGVMAIVRVGGVVAAGDAIVVELPAGLHVALGPV